MIIMIGARFRRTRSGINGPLQAEERNSRVAVHLHERTIVRTSTQQHRAE